MSNPPLLRINDATVSLEGKLVLNRLSLEIGEGEHTAILGPNGSGKSSLLKLITRTYLPVLKGRSPFGEDAPVALFGRSRWFVEDLRKLLGIVSADMHHTFVHETELTGLEAVLTGFFASRGLFRNTEVTPPMVEQARQALAWIEAGHLADRPLAHMSTGEARRILIARALVPAPRALILDEPTTGLDLVSARRFMHSVERLTGSGKTVILVTHHIEEIPPAVRRVILLKDGAVHTDGRKESVLTSATLSALYGAPVHVTQRNGYYTAIAEV